MASPLESVNVKTGYQKLLEIRKEIPELKIKVVNNLDSDLGMAYNDAGVTLVSWYEDESYTDTIYIHEDCLDEVVRVIKEIKGVDVL